MSTPDFTRRKHFPGTHGNPFDKVLRVMDLIESLPKPIFAVILLVLAILPTFGDLTWTGGLWIFLLGDWALLAALPRAGKSFGPAKPPALMLAVLRLPFALLPQPWAVLVQALGTLLVIYAFWIEPHRLTVTHQTLHTSKLARDGPPLRLLHLGDLHMERVTGRERELIRLTRELKPDVIVFTGDFLNLSNIHDPVAWEECRSVLRELAAPLGVFAVTGSPAVDQDEVVPRVLDGMPLHWLRDERVTLRYRGRRYELVGLACTHKPFLDAPRLAEILAGGTPNVTILLYHSPDLAPDAARLGADLQLSGHTHGGQVRLPFYGTLYAGSLYGKRFESGRYLIDGLTLYVTRGIGLEGKGAPRVRFLCPPEIILWEIMGN
jgi:predicted MPP superfamily phosphohydrolase